MATFTVDTDGISGDYSNLNAALAALPDPFTEDNLITCDASTAVKDTTDAAVALDTTASYRLTITGTDAYIYSPADGNQLEFTHAFGNTSNITIDGVNFEKPSMTANYQAIILINAIRDGAMIIKNNRFISDSGITNRERLIDFSPSAAHNVTTALVNNYFRTKGSSAHAASACIGHIENRPVYAYNNTFVGNEANYTNSALALYINNIINTTQSNYTVSGSSDYNMFSGAFDFGGGNDEQSQTFTFDDLPNDDVHLDSADTGARGKGTDLSSDANFPFNYDQDGVTRSAWDAGAFEFVGGGVTHQLVGSIDSHSSLTGLLNLTQRLSGSLNSISHTSGVLRLIQRLFGSLNSSSIISGTIRLIHGLSGIVSSISALVGNIRLKIGLSGTVESHSHLSGDLSVPTTQSLSGSIESHSLLSGTLTEEGIVETLFFNIDRTETLNFDIDRTTEIDYNIDITEEIDFDIDTE